MAKRFSDNFFRPPHGGRPPSDQAVHEATVRYVEWGRRNGITPSPEWEQANPRPTSATALRTTKGNNRAIN